MGCNTCSEIFNLTLERLCIALLLVLQLIILLKNKRCLFLQLLLLAKKGKGIGCLSSVISNQTLFCCFTAGWCLLVHFEAELCPPRCESQGECGVGGDGPHRHHRKLWSARVSQDGADQSQLEGGGDNVKDNLMQCTKVQ